MFKRIKEKLFMKANNIVDATTNIGIKLFNDKQACITIGILTVNVGLIIGGSIIVRGINIK